MPFGKKKVVEVVVEVEKELAFDVQTIVDWAVKSMSKLAEVLAPKSDTEIFIGSTLALVAFYFLIVPLTLGVKKDRKRRQSWIITLLSSVVMSIIGTYFAVRLVATDGAMLVAGLDQSSVDYICARCV